MQSSPNRGLSAHREVPVVIVGGSLIGLATAFFLSHFGIPVLLVEQHPVSPFPRAGNYNARSMELFRMTGIEEDIRKEEAADVAGAGVLSAESLAGKEFKWLTDTFTEEGEGGHSVPLPVRRSTIGQSQMESVLRLHARKLGADLRYNTKFLSWTSDSEGVTSVIHDKVRDVTSMVRSQYLIAADGGRSAIRQQLGIATQGPGTLAHQVRIVFLADLQAALRGRRIFICYVNNQKVRGPLAVFSPDAKAPSLLTAYHPERGEREEDFASERGIELIRAAVGIPDLAVTIQGVRAWELSAAVAESFQHGRVFLTGDAASVLPPSGGFGANTGIAGAYNLAWKLALVIRGVAHPDLLSTYDAERRPVALSTMGQAFARYATQWADEKSPPSYQIPPIMDYLTITFGYRYASTAIVAPQEDHNLFEDPLHPTGCPGSYAPHFVLESGGWQYSIRDLFGRQFVLLVGQDGEAWYHAAIHTAARLRLALTPYRIGPSTGFLDVESNWLSLYGITAGGAVLVRPDGFIAWKAESLSVTPEQELEQVILRMLSRRVAVPR